MKRLFPFVIVICVPLFTGQVQLRPELLFPGTYFPDQIHVRSGEEWFGVYQTCKGDRLIASNILVEKRYQSIDSLEYMLRISLNPKRDPIFLVRGIPNLSERSVYTIFSGKFFLSPPQTSIINFSDSVSYGFHATGTYKTEQGGTALYDYELNFFQFSAAHSQLLATFHQIDLDNPPSILWAGDLDGGGKLDFILELANHYAASEKVLYLSSWAKGNDYVEEVATFRTAD